jgi:hypothetical protein
MKISLQQQNKKDQQKKNLTQNQRQSRVSEALDKHA